jgi:hypothetical protein
MRSHPPMTGQCQLKAAAQGHSLDSRNHWLRNRFHLHLQIAQRRELV